MSLVLANAAIVVEECDKVQAYLLLARNTAMSTKSRFCDAKLGAELWKGKVRRRKTSLVVWLAPLETLATTFLAHILSRFALQCLTSVQS